MQIDEQNIKNPLPSKEKSHSLAQILSKSDSEERLLVDQGQVDTKNKNFTKNLIN